MLCSLFDPKLICFWQSLSACQWLPPLIVPGGYLTTERPWFWEETLWQGAGPESHDMEVASGGATGRCASVWEGFLHRNCVLSLPSWQPLFVSKRVDFLMAAKKKINSAFLKRLLVSTLSYLCFRACWVISAIFWVAEGSFAVCSAARLPLMSCPIG